MEKKKAFRGSFWPKDGDRPLVVGCAGAVTGYRLKEDDRQFRFREPVPIEKGDRISFRRGRGVCVNGVWSRPKADRWAPKQCVIGWVARRLRVAVFFERGRLYAPGRKDHNRPTSGWIAADLRSYHVSQGDTPLAAIRSLILTVRANEELAAQERRKGRRVIRERVNLRAQDHIAEMESVARKRGMIIDGVDWREKTA